MSSSSLIRKPKKKKLNAEQDTDRGSKSLDDFPNVLLQHILYFLPTKNAVGTSILSKRWRYLWTSLPNLDFREGLPAKRMHFLNFVERVLLLRDISRIKKFSLTCNVQNDSSRINAWISTAVRRNAQEFNICLGDIKETWVLPHCLFKCETMEVLNLEMPYILKLPSLICLSSLKILTLKNVNFLDDHSTELLLSGPALEKLVVDECNWANLPAMIISGPKLWSLTIREMDGDSSSDSDSEYSYSDSGGCQIMIYGTGLRIFNYRGELLNDYRFYNSSTLVKASIDVPSCCKKSREAAISVYKLLRGLSNVKDLKLSTDAVEVLTYAAEELADLSMFNDLTSLVLGPKPVDLSCSALQKILQNSPCLETLLFTEGISQSYKFDRILNPVPLCFLSHLKIIEVRDFYGNGEELYVVQKLLENATVLDTMIIYFASGLEERKEVEVLLSVLSRGSKSCKLVFN